jgi:hypothetical protein
MACVILLVHEGDEVLTVSASGSLPTTLKKTLRSWA